MKSHLTLAQLPPLLPGHVLECTFNMRACVHVCCVARAYNLAPRIGRRLNTPDAGCVPFCVCAKCKVLQLSAFCTRMHTCVHVCGGFVGEHLADEAAAAAANRRKSRHEMWRRKSKRVQPFISAPPPTTTRPFPLPAPETNQLGGWVYVVCCILCVCVCSSVYAKCC